MSLQQPISAACAGMFTTTIPLTPLARALDLNERVKDAVAQSATELLLVNTVLKQVLPGPVQTGEVAQALQEADALERQIQGLVEDLARISQLLAQAIGERAELDRELAAARTQFPVK